MQMEGEASSHHHEVSPSPSFSSYSSETLAEIAARVIEELRRDPHSVTDDDALYQPWENDNAQNDDEPNENDDDDDSDFEFAFASTGPNISPVSADDIFYNGQIRPMYPIFDRSLLFNAPAPLNDAVASVQNKNNEANTRRRRLPLRKLMFEDGETTSCSSSTDESVDLEGVAEGTYCVWTPNSVSRERKKSNSTGSGSKRWRLRNLLLRSHSEGKDKQQPVVFQIPANKVAAKPGSGGGASVESDGKNKTVGLGKDHGEQTKRKSFLPYRPELVGLFANANGLNRNLKPF
ncbi:hypothetical protein SESBI_42537 [Sesbania bispinosa]|nr:hypothetical protein SESBI_42537 [Sesbania bispinosa]